MSESPHSKQLSQLGRSNVLKKHHKYIDTYTYILNCASAQCLTSIPQTQDTRNQSLFKERSDASLEIYNFEMRF